ncbi:MAG: hypothetical protein Q4C56_06835 [Peptococcaceae bacterium]|nr:hypothetical protein [Peptococcaceae bacterium]
MQKIDSLNLMWGFLEMGAQRANYPRLHAACLDLRQLMTQKTAGQRPYAKAREVNFDDLEMIKNTIIIEALALVLSGEMEDRNDQ